MLSNECIIPEVWITNPYLYLSLLSNFRIIINIISSRLIIINKYLTFQMFCFALREDDVSFTTTPCSEIQKLISAFRYIIIHISWIKLMIEANDDGITAQMYFYYILYFFLFAQMNSSHVQYKRSSPILSWNFWNVYFFWK